MHVAPDTLVTNEKQNLVTSLQIRSTPSLGNWAIEKLAQTDHVGET